MVKKTAVTARKPKSRHAKRALERTAPKLVENTKTALFLRGRHPSQVAVDAMRSLAVLKKPHAIMLSRRNDVLPFETGGEASLEFLARKNDCSLFVVASHQKKRPHNLVLGRMFEFSLLDMVELGVDKYQPASVFAASAHGGRCATNSKPCVLFLGDAFETDPAFARIRNLLLDFFRGVEATGVNLAGLDHLIVVAAAGDDVDAAEAGQPRARLLFRHYAIRLKKRRRQQQREEEDERSGDADGAAAQLPRVQLDEIGPSMEWSVRRTRFATDEMTRAAVPSAKQRREAGDTTAAPRKTKNVSFDETRLATTGRVHVGKQDLGELALARIEGLVRRPRNATGDAGSGDGGDEREARGPE